MARQFRTGDSPWPDRYGLGIDVAKQIINVTQTYDGARASCSGALGGFTLTLGAPSSFANGDLVIIHQSQNTAGLWELNKIISGGGTTSLTMVYPLQEGYSSPGAQVVEMKQYSTFEISSNGNLQAPSWDGSTGGIIAFFVAQDLTMGSTSIDLRGFGFRGGAGSINAQATQGEGQHGLGGGSRSANGMGGGGGQGGQGGGFGGIAPTFELNRVFFGGGGGGGNTNGGAPAAGARGGGFLLIIARRISSQGAWYVTGGNGGIGSDNKGGSGGGGGGFVIVKCQRAAFHPGSVVNAQGGLGGVGSGLGDGGGSGAGRFNGGAGGGNGGNGGDGQIRIEYGQLFTNNGTINPAPDAVQGKILNDPSGGFFVSLLD